MPERKTRKFEVAIQCELTISVECTDPARAKKMAQNWLTHLSYMSDITRAKALDMTVRQTSPVVEMADPALVGSE